MMKYGPRYLSATVAVAVLGAVLIAPNLSAASTPLTIPPACTTIDNATTRPIDMKINEAATLNSGCRTATKENGTPIGTAAATSTGPAGAAVTTITFAQTLQGTIQRAYCIGGWDPDRASNPGYPAGCPTSIPWGIASAVIEWPETITSSTLYALGHVPAGWLVRTASTGWHYDTSIDFTLVRSGDCGMTNRANSADLGAGGLTSLTCSYQVSWKHKPTEPTLVSFPFYLRHGVAAAGHGGWLYICEQNSCGSEVQSLPIGDADAVAQLIQPNTGLSVSDITVTSGTPISGSQFTLDVAVHNGSPDTATAVTPSTLTFAPTADVKRTAGPTPTSHPSLASGGTTHFTYTVVASKVEDIVASIHATATIAGKTATTSELKRTITVHRGVTAKLTGPAKNPVMGTTFPVTITVDNDSGQTQTITAGSLTSSAAGFTTSTASPGVATIPDGGTSEIVYQAKEAAALKLPLVASVAATAGTTKQTVTAKATITVEIPSLIVTTNGDEEGTGIASADDRCDVDAAQAGDQCTLRAAIELSNTRGMTGQPQSIHFDIPGNGVPYLQPATALPALTATTSVDATTQNGGWVQMSGDGTFAGLTVDSSSSVIRGFVLGEFSKGIWLDSGTGSVVAHNRIGTDPTGTSTATSNANKVGIDVRAPNSVIGGTAGTTLGTCTGDCNLISGNDRGIQVDSGASVDVRGNLIGTDLHGLSAIANNYGVWVSQTNGTQPGAVTIGGTTSLAGRAPGNVISGNARYGVLLDAGLQNTVAGNIIGLDSSGSVAIASPGGGIGVQQAVGVDEVAETHAVIGGTSAKDGNVISGFNSASPTSTPSAAIAVEGAFAAKTRVLVVNDRIGTDLDGLHGVPNAVGVWGGGVADIHDSLISGNGAGVRNALAVRGSRIGTNAAGTTAIANNIGLFNVTTVGGRRPTGSTSCTDPCNVLSGNRTTAVNTADDVEGNFIGTDVTGTRAIPNGTVTYSSQFGDRVQGAVSFAKTIGGASRAAVHGTCDQACNLIAGNGGPGVDLDGAAPKLQGNLIGSSIHGNALPNLFGVVAVDAYRPTFGGAGDLGNRIAGNKDDAILVLGSSVPGGPHGSGPSLDIRGNAITHNGGGIHYVRSAANGLVAPTIPTTTRAVRSGTTVVTSGRVPALTASTATTTTGRIDVYASASCEAGPQGAVPFASFKVGGLIYDGTWQVVLDAVAISLHDITATVTVDGVTSPFSKCGRITAASPTEHLSSSSVTAGSRVSGSGGGFAANESITVTLHSKPVRLTTVRAGKTGRVSYRVTIPKRTVAGRHQVILRGTKSGFTASVRLVVKKHT